MATVDLVDLIPDLEAALTIPGTTSKYAAATDDEWAARLKNGFWSAYNEGVITGFTCDADGAVSPTSGTATFARDLQQIVLLYATINVIQNELMQMKNTRSVAGPVEYEVNQSAQVLKGLLDSFISQKGVILKRLSDLGEVDSYYIDAVRSRDASLFYGTTDWIR